MDANVNSLSVHELYDWFITNANHEREEDYGYMHWLALEVAKAVNEPHPEPLTPPATPKMDKAKSDKLKHYATRPLNRFTQYDVFLNPPGTPGDSMSTPDADGDEIFSGRTDELMHGAGVRILIKDGTSTADALRAIKKIRQWIKHDGVYQGQSTGESEIAIATPDIPF